VPAGASSDQLLRRPDVIQAEQALVAANANIGAARAAMFPRITLSGSAGVVSDTLSGLVNSGTFAWTAAGTAAMAIFDAGRNQANVKSAEIGRDITGEIEHQSAFAKPMRWYPGHLGDQVAAQDCRPANAERLRRRGCATKVR
jgi:hypothetical protein